MVLDTSLLNTQHYKVGIKGKVEQSREWSSALPYTFVVAIEKGMQGTPLLPLFPGPLWPGVVAPDRVFSTSQVELNCIFKLN